jgi:N4-gp56 family major capsid protein
VITQYGDISQRTAMFAIAEFLANVDPVIVLNKYGQNRPAPKNKSETIVFRRAVPYAPATVPLAEGVTPTGHAMSFQDVQVTLKQFGDIVLITDKVADLSEDPVLKVAMEESGKQAAATIEQITYGVVKAGTSVFYANGASRAAVNTAISLNKQRAVVRYLQRQKAKKFTKILSGSVNYATKPIEAAYIAVSHTDISPDIRGMANFVAVAAYGQRQPISEYELGSVEEVRYVLSPDLAPFPDAGGAAGGSVLSTTGTNADVYPVLIFGQDAYGVVPLKGQSSMSPTVLNPGTPSKSDPLGQRGYVGWKTWFNAVRLNETWMSRLEVAATNL